MAHRRLRRRLFHSSFPLARTPAKADPVCGIIVRSPDEGGQMAAIVEQIEIARRAEDVYSYVTDLSRLPEWQKSVVSVRAERDVPLSVGSRFVVTRRDFGREQAMTAELTELNPPSSWAVRGVDGPVRGALEGTIEPLGAGDRSRVTLAFDFEGHGIGK